MDHEQRRAHVRLTNRFIDAFNDAARAGHPIWLVCSAVHAAAAAYTAFSMTGSDPVPEENIDTIMALFRQDLETGIRQAQGDASTSIRVDKID